MTTVHKVADFNRVMTVPNITTPPTEEETYVLGMMGMALESMVDQIKENTNSTTHPHLLRARLMLEELAEVFEAMGLNDRVQMLHELVDLRYVTDGTVVALGFTDVHAAAFDLVHAANLSKLGPDGHPIRDENGKVIKGPNFQPANLNALLGLGQGDKC